MEDLSIAVISKQVGSTPEAITYSFVFDEVYRLTRRGIRVHVIRSKIEGDSLSYGIYFHGLERMIDALAIKLFLENAFTYPPISLLRKPWIIYRENRYALNAIRVVKKYNVDLIHAHFAYPEGLVGLLVKRKTGKPLIVTVHGHDINVVPEVGYGIRLDRRFDILIRTVLKFADKIICVSSEMERKILKLNVPREKLVVVFNAVDLDLFRPLSEKELTEINKVRRSLGVTEDDFLVLNARHLRPIYGLEYLIKAAKLVTKRMRNVKFIIAGDGPLYSKLNGMINCLGLKENVKLIGLVPRTFMPKLMQASDLYINTSLSDGMPPSLLEAMASGKSIISFNAGGAKDIIDDGINGYLVPLKDYKKLAEKIIYLLEKPSLIKYMGIKARKKAEKSFDANKRIEKIMSIYRNIRNSS